MRMLELSVRRPGGAASQRDGAFIAALMGGGDSRLVLDEKTLTNKYLCPQQPDDTLTCFSSCTASPISAEGFERAFDCYRQVMAGGRLSPDRLGIWRDDLERRLRDVAGGEAVGGIVLLPSGTDGLLFTALLLALEQPGRALTAILPAAPETGSGVPLAAACRQFDGPVANRVLHQGWSEPILVALRRPDGLPRSDGEINEGFSEAARTAPGRPVVFVTHGTKTGLVAPLEVPTGAEVVVDACQLRLSAASLQRYLRRGWPVVVTGSKFLGGPAFCGAVLLPRGRFETAREKALATWHRRTGTAEADCNGAPLGPLLRWVAALSSVRQPSTWEQVSTPMRVFQGEAEAALAELPGVSIVPGPSEAMVAAGDITPGIITFALHDGSDRKRRLPVDELCLVHKALAGRGVLVGQPVSLGDFGGLRLAISRCDISRGSIQAELARLRDALSCVECCRR